MADLNTQLVYQISFAICFKLSCDVHFLLMSIIVHTLLKRINNGCEVSKMQCIRTVVACTDPEPASNRLIKRVHNCIYLSHPFGAYPESCHNDTDYRQATRQTADIHNTYSKPPTFNVPSLTMQHNKSMRQILVYHSCFI